MIVAVHPSLPIKCIKDLIAFGKSQAGELNNSSGATGGQAHLAAELFKSMAGVNIVRITYKSVGQMVGAVINGEVQLTFSIAGGVAPRQVAPRLRGLAVTGSGPFCPDLPTVAASGLPGYGSVNMTGILHPPKRL